MQNHGATIGKMKVGGWWNSSHDLEAQLTGRPHTVNVCSCLVDGNLRCDMERDIGHLSLYSVRNSGRCD